MLSIVDLAILVLILEDIKKNPTHIFSFISLSLSSLKALFVCLFLEIPCVSVHMNQFQMQVY